MTIASPARRAGLRGERGNLLTKVLFLCRPTALFFHFEAGEGRRLLNFVTIE